MSSAAAPAAGGIGTMPRTTLGASRQMEAENAKKVKISEFIDGYVFTDWIRFFSLSKLKPLWRKRSRHLKKLNQKLLLPNPNSRLSNPIWRKPTNT